MSLDTKRAEIQKLEERARQREEALKKSEQVRLLAVDMEPFAAIPAPVSICPCLNLASARGPFEGAKA